jgi:hypothetical protein
VQDQLGVAGRVLEEQDVQGRVDCSGVASKRERALAAGCEELMSKAMLLPATDVRSSGPQPLSQAVRASSLFARPLVRPRTAGSQ